MVHRKIDGKESLELKKVYNHYLHKRSDMMKNTQFKVENVFGDIVSKNSIPPEIMVQSGRSIIAFLDQKLINIINQLGSNLLIRLI